MRPGIVITAMHRWIVESSMEQECIPVGCVPPASVAVSTRGCVPLGRGSICLWVHGVSASGSMGCLPPLHHAPFHHIYPFTLLFHHTPPFHHTALFDHIIPPRTEWITDRCKNITFPQLRLRAVIIRTSLFNNLHWQIRARDARPLCPFFFHFHAVFWKIWPK